ncbi:chromosome segregation protein SMC [Leuconostoc carnosum]|mgnify:CR=1 FL=1|uniref:Chromosome partition protein Smc n=2 Tax=Leuconostoc carnosum TaxID=1252 RepID=K0D983_LEUCJ|nr:MULTISPECIES: chromosome segregation protein SMC [Leuconostoc]AFT81353.1 chromosome partition protein [Leuconostoc carnosum JB16]KAA8325961.1 chromosome segregation protein SMC [Leuconostoc carnosum]KAA8330170.1 chromosome segregation protein SMC [Leuconostoc carnosum]KAA8362244.1 chromosome segregation protein SMC [Leuconostoc carnosum]KAA8366793.1 chromosome segregation protein SMC [Leuconostoc carnosum]
MKLKSLEISGFKSFADKTVIEFMPGMTGIVGPNGSGKSNIIEAVQWVMGEQSAKDLRGTRMSDIIFGGTRKRGALNRAEVAMTFDNSDHYVKSEFNEVRISRKLYRSGESSYQINGVDSRLRDIHELFMDTGLGRESFSIISQGRVESIFNAKPENRRGIIEEVAGVYKYKQNKEKAQKELSQTSDNLARVADIIHEISGRLEPLAEQSAQATDYLSQKERFDILDKLRLALTKQYLEDQVQQVLREVEKQDHIVNQSKSALDILNQSLSEKRQERTSTQLARDKLQQDILHMTQDKERLIGAENLSSQQIEILQRDIVHNKAQLDDFSTRLGTIAAQRQTLKSKQEDLVSEKQVLQQQIDNFDEKKYLQSQSTLQSQIAQNRHAYIQTMQDIAALHNALQTNDKLKQQLEQRIQTTQKRLISEQDKLQDLKEQLEIYQPKKLKTFDTDHLEKQVRQLQQQLEQASATYKTDEKRWYEALNQLNKTQSQRDARNTLDEYVGFYQGVRVLMKPDIRQNYAGIKGVIAELMTVPAQYTLAIETVLGGALQQVVVDNTHTAKQVIHYLTQNRAGRVTILPMDTIKGRHLNLIDAVKKHEGFVGVASELVTMPTEMTAIKANLLGGTILAKDLSAATEIAKLGQYHFRVVSLDGQLVNVGGSMTGGANQRRGATILGRQSELLSLNDRVDVLTQQAQVLESSLKSQRVDNEKTRNTLQDARNNLASVQNETEQVDYTLSRQQDEIKQQQHVIQALEYELKDLESQQTDNNQQLVAQQQQLDKSQSVKAQQEVEAKELQQALSQASTQSQSNQEQRATVQTQFATVQAQVDSLVSQLQLLDSQRDDLLQQQKTVFEALKTLQQQFETVKHKTDNDIKVATLSQQLTDAQVDFEQQTHDIEVLTSAVTALESQFVSQQEKLRHNISLQSQTAAQLARLQTQLDNIQKQLLTQYDIVDVTDVLDANDSRDLTEIESQLQLLKRSLDEIGSVNLGAIAEYEEVQTRFEFLTQQRDDLDTARQTLLQTINEMDQEVQIRFKKTFDAVAEHFSNIYSQMFGGGRAEIRLTDPEHLLTTGIDITAQPPGKKFQQMSLLSGGEKALTAITLLFAILHVRPVPFVILDEAEAALDEANVARFARYLHDFAGDTQFIVITHRKGTMMNANLLYGVTMQEAGVSKMVAVDLDKATGSVG